MLEIEIFSENRTASLTFSGDLGVAHAAELQQQLLQAGLEEITHLEIKIKQPENMDLSFLQLLFLWSKEMKQSEKSLIFDFDMDDELKRIFEESGFEEAFLQL